MELRLVESTGRPLIEAYGAEGFRIGGLRHEGPVMILMDHVEAWAPRDIAALTLADLTRLADERPEILIVGTGAKFQPLAPTLRAELRAKGIGVETMATAAACRTYNILAGENRRVVAALLPAEDLLARPPVPTPQ